MSTPSYRLRPATPADAAAVADLIRTTFAGITPALIPPPSAIKETAETVAAQLAAGGGMLAEADGKLIGAVLWGEREGGLYVGRLSVDGAWRRHGVAQSLVAAAEVEARRLSLPHMHVGVRLALLGNRRLFAGLGFHETTLHTHDGFDAPTWVAMEKPLA